MLYWHCVAKLDQHIKAETNNILKLIFLHKLLRFDFSLKFGPSGAINNRPALIQIMA